MLPDKLLSYLCCLIFATFLAIVIPCLAQFLFAPYVPEISILVGHRGAKFLVPEHTLAAYDIAVRERVDYLETDLVLTSDGQLICTHHPALKNSTDIGSRPEFADRMTKSVNLIFDGDNQTEFDDWWSPDLTLEEIKTLRVYQQDVGLRSHVFDGLFSIPTFQEYIDLVHRDTYRRVMTNRLDFVTGIIPELKVPVYHNEQAFKEPHYMEKKFIEVLKANGYMDNDCEYNGTKIPCSPIIVQCYDVPTIEYLKANTNLQTLILLDEHSNPSYLTYEGMKGLQGKTDYVGVWKEFLYQGVEPELIYYKKEYNKKEVRSLGGFIRPGDFVGYLNELGLKLGVFTLYHSAEESKRGCAIQCVNMTKEQEMHFYLNMGIKMFFTEGLGESLRIRDAYYGKGLANGFNYGSGAAYSGNHHMMQRPNFFNQGMQGRRMT